jgi:hypothetical protein
MLSAVFNNQPGLPKTTPRLDDPAVGEERCEQQ